MVEPIYPQETFDLAPSVRIFQCFSFLALSMDSNKVLGALLRSIIHINKVIKLPFFLWRTQLRNYYLVSFDPESNFFADMRPYFEEMLKVVDNFDKGLRVWYSIK